MNQEERRLANLKVNIKKRRDEILFHLKQQKNNMNRVKELSKSNAIDIRECNTIKSDWNLLFLYQENRIIQGYATKNLKKNLRGIEEKCITLFVKSDHRYYKFIFLILEISIFIATIFKNRMKKESPSRIFDYEESLFYYKRCLRLVCYLQKKSKKNFILRRMSYLHCDGKRIDLWMKALQKLDNEILTPTSRCYVLHLKFKILLEKREFSKADVKLHELNRICQKNNIFLIWDKVGRLFNDLMKKHMIAKPFDSKISGLTGCQEYHRNFSRKYPDLETRSNQHVVSNRSKPAGVEYQRIPGNIENDHDQQKRLESYLGSKEHKKTRDKYNESISEWNKYMELLRKCGVYKSEDFPTTGQLYQFLNHRDLNSLKHYFDKPDYRKKMEYMKKMSKTQLYLPNVTVIKLLYIEGSMYYFLVKEELRKFRRNQERKEFKDVRDDTDREIRKNMADLATKSMGLFDQFYRCLKNRNLGDEKRGEIYLQFMEEARGSIPKGVWASWDGQTQGRALQILMRVRSTKSHLFRFEMKIYKSEAELETRERQELREKIRYLRRQSSGFDVLAMKVERLYNKFCKVTVSASYAKKRVLEVCKEKKWVECYQRVDIRNRLGISDLDFEISDDEVEEYEFGDVEEEKEEEDNTVFFDDENGYFVEDEDELIVDEDEDDDEEEEEVPLRGKENINSNRMMIQKKKKKKKEPVLFIDLTEEEEEEDKKISKMKKKKKKVRFKDERVPMKNKRFVSPKKSHDDDTNSNMEYFIQPPPPPPPPEQKGTKKSKSKKKKNKSRSRKNNSNHRRSSLVGSSSSFFRESESSWAVKKVGKKRKRRSMGFDSVQEEQEFHQKKKMKRNVV